MNTQFFCKNKNRLKLIIDKHVKGQQVPNGIDYLEVFTFDQKTLKVYFAFDLISSPLSGFLTSDNVFIEGGVRIKDIKVLSATPLNNVLTVVVDKAGDFSTYTLRIGNSSTDKDTPPAGFDKLLSSIDFSFKINCPTEFDCKTETECPPEKLDEPDIDYLAKDYSSFKRLMLDRISAIAPEFKERNAADLEIALIELLAYVGDHLSYYQDAVATEAYIGTARRRVSLKRHARLLDYFVHDGCNARVWVQIMVNEKGTSDGAMIEKGNVLLAHGDEDKITVTKEEKEKLLIAGDVVVFETMHNITLKSAHNIISFYTWGDTDCCLPKGTTKATLLDHSLSSPPSSPVSSQSISLKEGDVLIFEEMYGPLTGKAVDADPLHRHAVRLKKIERDIVDEVTNASVINIEWYDEDALPFSLCLTSSVNNNESSEVSVAYGNIVLADHGMTISNITLDPDTIAEREKMYPKLEEKYYPKLRNKNITSLVAYDHDIEKQKAASQTTIQYPGEALPSIKLIDGLQLWNAKWDLLGSDRFAPEFVVETEQDGTSFLRFGDDIQGKKPLGGTKFMSTYRVGNGNAGNIGADAINTIEWKQGGILKVRNPLPAAGGINAETMEEISQFAPEAFRVQERAVTESDYVEKTELHPEVQKAAAKFYWTGSWYTVFITIDRKGGKDIDEEFKEEIKQHLERYRMAGYDLEIRQPKFVSLNILLNVCVKPGYFRANVKQSLLRLFSNSLFADGTRGFFHPDNFTFGQSVYLSPVYEKAMSVEGIDSVEIKEFRPWLKKKGNEIDDGVLTVSELEIIRLDNDPNFPENGKIDFTMLGGL